MPKKKTPAKKPHYQTLHLMSKVHGEHVSLHDNGTHPPGTDIPEPKLADRALSEQLDDLFNGGAHLAFEMNFGWDDEGGNCYQAFILKADHVQRYSDAFIDTNDPTFPARFYASNPEDFWILWQGAY